MRTSVYTKSRSVAAVSTNTVTVNTAAVNGATVDLWQANTGDYRTALFVLRPGTLADGTFVATLEDSDNGSEWAAAPARGAAEWDSATDSNVVRDLGYDGQRRFVRCVITPTGGTTGGPFSAVAVLYDSAGYQR